jgi:hypothetical protein
MNCHINASATAGSVAAWLIIAAVSAAMKK